jgi:prevent-host-death family protein
MLRQTINVDEAKSRLADLIAIVSQGGEVIITQDGKPLAQLVPVAKPKGKRIAGLNRGSIWTSPDFDEPLPDEFWLGKSEN